MPAKLRITFVLPDASLGGGTRVVAIYASKLHARGHDVTVVSTPRAPMPFKQKVRAVVRGQGWPQSVPPSHLDDTPAKRVILDRWRPVTDADLPDADVVIATWWETAESVANLGAEKGAKLYLIQHDESLFATSPQRALATWSLPMHKIAVAQWLADLARARGSSADEISLIPNAVDLDQFHAPPRGKQPTPTVGMMYSTTKFKACDIALEAVQLARQARPDLKLIAFGSRAVESFLPLAEGATYFRAPAQDQIRDIYASCDAWIVASRTEGFGLPVLEAMACRTPVIATPTGAAPELLSGGGGMLVKIDDPADLSRAIKWVTSMDDPAWRAISDVAHASATKYTWDDATNLFETALQRATANVFSPA